MNYVYDLYNQMKYMYMSVNPATLSGAIDVIVVEQPDGTLLSTPFHVRFGKYGVFSHENKYVYIEINKREVENLRMKLGENGIAFFHNKSQLVDDIADGAISDSEIDRHRRDSDADTTEWKWGDIRESKKKDEKKDMKRSSSWSRIKRNKSQHVDDIADGALSDSEIDRHRRDSDADTTEWKWGEIPESKKKDDGALSDSEVDLHHRGSDTDTTEWKWGEIPESKKKDEKKDMKRSSAWWFRWRTKNSLEAQQNKEEGVSLDDLAKDPAKMSYYIGAKRNPTASVSSVVDSGRVSLGTSSCSPSILSLEDDVMTLQEDSTPTNEPTDTKLNEKFEAKIAQKDDSLPIETKASYKDEPCSSSSEPMNTTKVRCESGNSQVSTSTFGSGLSDDEPTLKKPKHSLRLSSDQLKQLGLEYGPNEVRFTITTKFQGTAWCSCYIYLYKWSDQLVISDIDGTITKSDVLGHVIPAIGGTWAQTGVAELYSRIEQNGYKMIYLSSRAIGQAHYTKIYLKTIQQGSTNLPDGPLLLSPTSVLMAFRKEVIERRPEEFKIACLSDLKSLFPVELPFFAGFGNRETDIKSYLAVKIPPQRILIINSKGLVRRADNFNFTSDYRSMAMETVDYTFPPLPIGNKCEVESSTYNIWRNKASEFVTSESDLNRYKAKRVEKQKKRK